VSEMALYPEGRPCWIDLLAHQQEGAMEYYAKLFGWKYDVAPPEYGGYALAKVGSLIVAGIGRPPGNSNPNSAAFWTTYLATDDVEGTTERALGYGASLLIRPMPVGYAGKMAVLSDPTGAVVGLWEAGEHPGAQLTGMHSTMAWHELQTRDTAAARGFYLSAFEYEIDKIEDVDYTMLTIGDEPVAAVAPMPADLPPQVPSHWLVYFAVIDVDDACATAERHGGGVLRGPFSSPYGRYAVILDPFGAMFALITPPAAPGATDI
jgi:uncharacterized protein